MPMRLIFSVYLAPTASSAGPPWGNAVWMTFHSPKRSKSVMIAHTLSAGAGTDALTETLGMIAPLLMGPAGPELDDVARRVGVVRGRRGGLTADLSVATWSLPAAGRPQGPRSGQARTRWMRWWTRPSVACGVRTPPNTWKSGRTRMTEAFSRSNQAAYLPSVSVRPPGPKWALRPS